MRIKGFPLETSFPGAAPVAGLFTGAHLHAFVEVLLERDPSSEKSIIFTVGITV